MTLIPRQFWWTIIVSVMYLLLKGVKIIIVCMMCLLLKSINHWCVDFDTSISIRKIDFFINLMKNTSKWIDSSLWIRRHCFCFKLKGNCFILRGGAMCPFVNIRGVVLKSLNTLFFICICILIYDLIVTVGLSKCN